MAPSSLARGFVVETESELRPRAQLKPVADPVPAATQSTGGQDWYWLLWFLFFCLKVRPDAVDWERGRSQELREGFENCYQSS